MLHDPEQVFLCEDGPYGREEFEQTQAEMGNPGLCRLSFGATGEEDTKDWRVRGQNDLGTVTGPDFSTGYSPGSFRRVQSPAPWKTNFADVSREWDRLFKETESNRTDQKQSQATVSSDADSCYYTSGSDEEYEEEQDFCGSDVCEEEEGESSLLSDSDDEAESFHIIEE